MLFLCFFQGGNLYPKRQLSHVRPRGQTGVEQIRQVSFPGSALPFAILQNSSNHLAAGNQLPQPLSLCEISSNTAALHKPPSLSGLDFLLCKMRSLKLASPAMCAPCTHGSLLMPRDPRPNNFGNKHPLLPLGNSQGIVVF